MSDAAVVIAHADGMPARTLYANGATFAQLLEVGYGLREMPPPRTLYADGVTYEQLVAAGYDLTQLVDAVPLDVLMNKGVPVEDLVSAGASLPRLALAGVSRDDMLALGYPEGELGDFLNLDGV